ncbi:MAG: hypothetical protein AAB214_13070, partial [Fibrobacterota bacterium]
MTTFSIVAAGLQDGADERAIFVGGSAETYALNADKTATVTFGGTTFSIAYTAASKTFAVTK